MTTAAPQAPDLAAQAQPPSPEAVRPSCDDGEPATAPRKPVAPHTCNGCDVTWTGHRIAHGACCHRTFASVGLFDKHRSMAGDHGTCHHPASVTTTSGERVMFLRDGMWKAPEMTDEEKTAAFGNRT